MNKLPAIRCPRAWMPPARLGAGGCLGALLLITACRADAQAPPPLPPRAVQAGLADLSAYRQARTPTAGVTLGSAKAAAAPSAQSQGDLAAAVPAATPGIPPAARLPAALGGVLSEVSLGFLTKDPVPPANVTLQFDAARAGASVWVQALDGGTLQPLSAGGSPARAGSGLWIALDPAGQLGFTFQAPARSSRYQVLIRLDNVSTILPFVIPDPRLDN